MVNDRDEEKVDCPYGLKNFFRVIYPRTVMCSMQFGKDAKCLMSYDYSGIVDWEGEGPLNICPVNGRIFANQLEKEVKTIV